MKIVSIFRIVFVLSKFESKSRLTDIPLLSLCIAACSRGLGFSVFSFNIPLLKLIVIALLEAAYAALPLYIEAINKFFY